MLVYIKSLDQLVHFREEFVNVNRVWGVERVETVLRVEGDPAARIVLLRVFRKVHLNVKFEFEALSATTWSVEIWFGISYCTGPAWGEDIKDWWSP